MKIDKAREEKFQQGVQALRRELDDFLAGDPLAPDFEERLLHFKKEEKEILDQLLNRHKIDLAERESTVKIKKLETLGPANAQGYIKDYIPIRPDLYLCLTSKRIIQLLSLVEREKEEDMRVQWSLPIQGIERRIFHQEARWIGLEAEQEEKQDEKLYLNPQGKLILEERIQDQFYQKEIPVDPGIFFNQIIKLNPGAYLGLDLDGRAYGMEIQTLREGEDLWRMKL